MRVPLIMLLCLLTSAPALSQSSSKVMYYTFEKTKHLSDKNDILTLISKSKFVCKAITGAWMLVKAGQDTFDSRVGRFECSGGSVYVISWRGENLENILVEEWAKSGAAKIMACGLEYCEGPSSGQLMDRLKELSDGGVTLHRR